ncbi:MAG: diguanylate cyclase [Pseudomonadales bacterium]|nr:diguanylate cyclase [Pseudomonadales bacterium]
MTNSNSKTLNSRQACRPAPWLWIIFNLSFGFILAGVAGKSVAAVLLNAELKRVEVGQQVEVYEDASGELTISELTQYSIPWQIHTDNVVNKGYSDSAWWIRFQVYNAGPVTDWLLQIAYPVLDDIQIYEVVDGQVRNQWQLGDKYPFAERNVENRNFVVPFHLPEKAQVQLLIRVHSSSSIQVPISFWQPLAFFEDDARNSWFQGGFFGALIIIAVYNLLLFLGLRDVVYLFYVGYVVCMALFSAGIGGWAYQYLWPEEQLWNDRILLFVLTLTLFFGMAFSARFVVRFLSDRVNRLQSIAIAVSAVLVVLSLLIDYAQLIQWVVVFSVAVSAWAIFLGVVAWYRKIPAARWYTLSWGILACGVLLLGLSKYGFLPSNRFTNYAIQIGILLEVILLSFALAERIANERALRLRAQQRALEIQRLATLELETRVADRTRELQLANEKLQTLSDTDQLTQLGNRRYLEHFMSREIARAVRYGRVMAVFLIDIDHFKTINDEQGHLVGDDCLREVALRISTVVRETDLVARYGGEEFCVVLLEPDSKRACDVAERIRRAIADTAINTRGGAVNLTVSIGCCVGIPQGDTPMQAYLEKADTELYHSKHQGRDCIHIAWLGADNSAASIT